jgi:hypothetical protein
VAIDFGLLSQEIDRVLCSSGEIVSGTRLMLRLGMSRIDG